MNNVYVEGLKFESHETMVVDITNVIVTSY